MNQSAYRSPSARIAIAYRHDLPSLDDPVSLGSTGFDRRFRITPDWNNLIKAVGPDDAQPPIAGVLDRNIHAIINNRKEEDKSLSWQERLAQTITGVIGTIRFVIINLAVFVVWGICNCGLFASLRFDPGYSILDVLISIEAIFLTVFVLINQNTKVKTDARRADLNLQVSLLAEHEITHLVQLVTAIAGKLHLEHAKNPELGELQNEIKPEQILAEMDIRQEKADKASLNEAAGANALSGQLKRKTEGSPKR